MSTGPAASTTASGGAIIGHPGKKRGPRSGASRRHEQQGGHMMPRPPDELRIEPPVERWWTLVGGQETDDQRLHLDIAARCADGTTRAFTVELSLERVGESGLSADVVSITDHD